MLSEFFRSLCGGILYVFEASRYFDGITTDMMAQDTLLPLVFRVVVNVAMSDTGITLTYAPYLNGAAIKA